MATEPVRVAREGTEDGGGGGGEGARRVGNPVAFVLIVIFIIPTMRKIN